MPPESPTPRRVRLGNRALALVEDAIYVSIAALLAAAAVVVVVRASFALVRGTLEGGPNALLDTLDEILLVFIFVELLYAVRITLKERQIVAEPFLIAGILVCIKEIIVLAVTGANEYIGKGPEFARAMVEIGLLGVLVVLLASSSVILRKKENEPEENSNTDSADDE